MGAYQYMKMMANPEMAMAKMDPIQRAGFKAQVVDAMGSEQRIAFQTLAKLLDEQWQLMGDIDISVSEQCLKGHLLIRNLFLKDHINFEIFNAFKDAHLMMNSLINEGDSGQVLYTNNFFSSHSQRISDLNQKNKNTNFQSQCSKQLGKLKGVWALMQERSKQKPLTFTLSSAVQSELAEQSKSGADNDNDQENKHEKKPGF